MIVLGNNPQGKVLICERRKLQVHENRFIQFNEISEIEKSLSTME